MSMRDLSIGLAAVTAAVVIGFLAGVARPLDWMPVPPEMVSGAHARPLPPPPPPYHPHPSPIDRAIDQLFLWPAGGGADR